MPQTNEIFEFLSDQSCYDLLNQSKTEGITQAQCEDLSRKQYYSRLLKAKELGLVRRAYDSKYRITTLGTAMLNYSRFLAEVLELEWMLKSVDVQDDESVRKNLIRELFSARPDIRRLISDDP